MTENRFRLILFGALFLACAAVRLAFSDRQGLWADEAFSLAIATGHSLEHPAASAEPRLGDFQETSGAMPASALARYLEHDREPAGPRRVVRAVYLSDTNPPLYYLALWGWTRIAGTSDFMLRTLSVVFAMGSFTLLWLIGQRVGGIRTAAFAGALFALAPLSIYYSTEGRMYSLLWLLVLATALATLELARSGFRPWPVTAFILSAVAGFYTHYFFVFPFVACAAWLALRPGRLSRPAIGLLLLSTGALILPWYLLVPRTLGLWRVTQSWLYWRPGDFSIPLATLEAGWKLIGLSTAINWPYARVSLLASSISVLLLLLWIARERRRAFAGEPLLLWLWLAAALLGPGLFDAARNTYVSAIPRYSISAMPAGIILISLAWTRLARGRLGFAAGLLAALLLSAGPLLDLRARDSEPIREFAQSVAEGSPDLVILHGIPSAMAAFARYLPPRTPTVSWVPQLQVRGVPEDLQRTLAGRTSVAAVSVHPVGDSGHEFDWLRENSRVVKEYATDDPRKIRVLQLSPADGNTFR